MLTLPTEIQLKNLNYLELSDQANLANTCKDFDQLVNDEKMLEQRLVPTDLKMANTYFFKKFFYLLTPSHLSYFNYQLITRKELNQIYLNSQDSNEKNKVRTAQFLHSLQLSSLNSTRELEEAMRKNPDYELSFKKVRGQKEWETFYHASPYHQLSQSSIELLPQFDVIHQKALGKRLDEIAEEDIAKHVMGNETEKTLIRQHKILFPTNHVLMAANALLITIDSPRMQLMDSELLERLYVNFWKKYKIKQLYNYRNPLTYLSDAYTCMPSPMFRGICHAIKTDRDRFGKFASWALTDDNLQAWNMAFEHRVVESLNVALHFPISSSTLTTFTNIILKFDSQTPVSVCYMYPMDQIRHSSVQQFLNLKQSISNKNRNWMWCIQEHVEERMRQN